MIAKLEGNWMRPATIPVLAFKHIYLACLLGRSEWIHPLPNTPTTSLPPPFDSISPARFIWRFSDNAQRIPFPNLPKNPPFIPTVRECMKGWHQAGEKKQGGRKKKKKRCTSGSEGGVTGSGMGWWGGGGRQKQCESSALVAWAESLQVV